MKANVGIPLVPAAARESESLSVSVWQALAQLLLDMN